MQRTLGMPSGSGADAVARQAAADAATAAASAAAAAANSRQMVLNRDPKLDSLQATADTAQAAIVSSAEDRALLHQRITELAATVAALPRTVMASGQAKTTSLLALGGSVDVVVTLTRSMPSTTYNVEVIPISSTLVAGNANVVVKSKTTTTVTLTVTALVAVASSSVVSVIAWS